MFEDISIALTPIYKAGVNEAILLYEGDINLIVAQDEKLQGHGTIHFDWYPFPAIWFKADLYDFMHIQGYDHTIEIPGLNIFSKTRISQSSFGTNGCFAKGHLAPFDIGKGDQLSYIIFHLTNFSAYSQSNSWIQEGTQQWSGRIIIESEKWKVTIDSLKEHKEIQENLKIKSGYAITNVAKLERIDAQTFTSEEAENILIGLNHFLSFLAGRWVGAILPIGFDSNNNKIWEKWFYHKLESYQPARSSSWFPSERPSDLTSAFKGFMKKYLDLNWQEPLMLLVYEYVEANNTGCEPAIIIIQAAFELLAWLILVEQNKTLSKNSYKNSDADNLLRQTLSFLQIPLELPQPSDYRVDELQKLASTKEFLDSVKCITEVRNKIAHPKRSNIDDPILKYSGDIHIETSLLSIWYLEMCLLKIFEYEGVYVNRLRKNRRAGSYDKLPWHSVITD